MIHLNSLLLVKKKLTAYSTFTHQMSNKAGAGVAYNINAAGGGVAYNINAVGGGVAYNINAAGEQTSRPQRAAAVASECLTARQLGYFSATSDTRGGVTYGYLAPSYNAYNGAVQAQQQYHHSNGGFTSGEGYARYGSR